MKHFLQAILFFLPASAAIPFFQYQRAVSVPAAGQHYMVVDESLSHHTRPDLGDLRLYDGQHEVPYALAVERGGLHTEEQEIRVLQPSVLSGKTQFLLDMNPLLEYDHINIRIAARDFVAHARVEGQDDLHGTKWADLGGSILYDLSHDKLGSNNTLRLPRTTYRYLRVSIDGPVKPADILGATASERQEEKAVWRPVAGSPSIENRDKDTVLTFTVPENVPVERVSFELDPEQPNFRRPVEIRNEKNEPLASSEITRVHIVREGRRIDSELTKVDFFARPQKSLKVIVHNGDDPALRLNSVQLQQYERRLYFDTSAPAQLTLYYGDDKLDPPVYDYAKLFQQDKAAAAVAAGDEQTNAAFTGRPDDRPWSERHPAILWIAIIAAVLVLGGVALRSLKSAPAEPQS